MNRFMPCFCLSLSSLSFFLYDIMAFSRFMKILWHHHHENHEISSFKPSNDFDSISCSSFKSYVPRDFP